MSEAIVILWYRCESRQSHKYEDVQQPEESREFGSQRKLDGARISGTLPDHPGCSMGLYKRIAHQRQVGVMRR